jgi:hypothetical protein
MNPYGNHADDFYLYCYLNTEMELPNNRDTVLHYFGQASKAFPNMTHFHAREDDEFMLEEDKEGGSYRWMGLEGKRLASGYFNPPELDDCHPQHELMLEMCGPILSVSHLDTESLDLTFGFDFAYKGNHDEVVAQAFGMDTRFESFLRMPNAKFVNYEPNITMALDENCRLQARLGIVTRTSSYQIRTNQFGEESISVYFTIRQYWGTGAKTSLVESYRRQFDLGVELLDAHIVPNVVVPLAETIATR